MKSIDTIIYILQIAFYCYAILCFETCKLSPRHKNYYFSKSLQNKVKDYFILLRKFG